MDNILKTINGGLFIVVEGVDGAGKTRMCQELADTLRDQGYAVTTTREPGSGEVGKALRKILLENTSTICKEAEAFLYAADRAQHLQEVIIPCLEKGHIVISDRYYASTIAYQGFGHGRDLSNLKALQILAGTFEPDITLVLMCSEETAQRRSKMASAQCAVKASEQRFENMREAFTRRVHSGYQKFVDHMWPMFDPRPDSPLRHVCCHVFENNEDGPQAWQEFFSDVLYAVTNHLKEIPQMYDAPLTDVSKHSMPRT